jgi:iron complex outermembrane recepter protein
MNLRRSLLLLSVSAASIMASQPAIAQAADDGATVGEVIVTAQRRAQNIQDVPLAVTAFSQQQIEAAQLDEAADLVRFTPSVTGGLNTGTGSALSFFIRGLGSTEQVATFDVPVATYVDEIYFARQSANAVSLFDVERIEVLRGPQGTLFGRNTTGGAISIVTRKPANEFKAFVEGSIGSFDRRMARGSVDLPVSETLLTKLTGFYAKDDGFARSLTTGQKLNAEDSWGVRGAVRWMPSETLTWDVSVDYIDQSRTTLGSNPVDPEYTSRSGLRVGECGDDTIKDLIGSSLGNCANVRTGGLTSNLEWDAGFATINFISGYRQINQSFAIDFFNGVGVRGGYAIANEVQNEQYTQEIKVVGETGALNYVAGAFYLDEESKTSEVDVFGVLLADWQLDNSTKSYAVYAQGDYALTDQLTVTLGGRFTSEKKRFGYLDGFKAGTYPANLFVAVPAATARPTTANVVARGIPLSQKTEKFTPRVAVSYKIDDDKMLFASATRGFKSGGWNTRVTNIASVTIFGPETAWSYEMGARTDWLDNRLRVNLTAYRLDVEDLQLLSGAGTVFSTRNAGDLRATGLELEVTANPFEGLNVFASGSISDKKYRNVPPAVGVGGVPCTNTPEPLNCTTTRDDPVRFPDQQGTLGLSYQMPLADMDSSLTFNAAASFSGRYWSSTYNDTPIVTAIPFGQTVAISRQLSLVPVTTLINAGIVFRTDDRHWEAALECSNCAKEYYATSSLFGLGYYNEPRRFTFRVKYSY